MTQGVAFAFGLSAVAVVLLLGRLIGRGSSKLLVLVLAGVVISSIFSAFTSLIKYVADSNDKLPAIVFWLMGSFARSGSWNNLIVLAITMLLGAVPLMLLRHRMNVLSFGEEEAQSMGLDVRRTRLVIICCATILTAAAVTLCGNIGWVGLILPHLMRLVVGPDHRFLLPGCLLAGGLFMLVVDNTVRILLPGEMPVGIVTSLIGAPLFTYLLFQGRKDWV